MEVQERLAAKVKGAAAPVVDTGPRAHLGEHVLEVAEPVGINTAHGGLLRM
jgi:hypothetical protein